MSDIEKKMNELILKVQQLEQRVADLETKINSLLEG